MNKKIIIAGGRDFNNYVLLTSKLDYFLANFNKTDIEIICGTCRGADKLGEKYAIESNLTIKYFPADWDNLGKKAGYIRNQQMAEYANYAIIFWDGKSKGSKNMIDLCKKYKLNFRVIGY